MNPFRRRVIAAPVPSLRAPVELFGMAQRPERFDKRREAARCGAGSRHAVT